MDACFVLLSPPLGPTPCAPWPRQREIITDTCRARGWALADVIEDIDVSATKTRLDRPGLSRVRDAVRDGRADVVMVWRIDRIDRIARSVSDLASLTEEWDKARPTSCRRLNRST